jgi:hypothetical protein
LAYLSVDEFINLWHKKTKRAENPMSDDNSVLTAQMINNIITNTEDINNISTSISSGAQYVILHSKNR